ncbi:MAG: MFS transporter [Alphaproteobacteria bacterium]|nr:MFS transporter [Alphaproteobacteria bacterium]
MVAGIVGVVLSMTLIPDDLQDWGWRIAFALGMILVPVAFYLRRYLPETLPKITDSAAKLPQAQLRHYTKELVLAILVTAGGAVSTYVALFMTSFAIATLKMPATISLSATIIVGVAIFSFSLVGGWLSDKYGRRNVIFVSRILLILVSIPAFMWLINAKTPEVLFIVAFTISALSTLSSAPLLVAVLELFPIRVRALGLSIAYAVGVSIFGGTTQFIITWLLKSTESLYSPAWYMMATSLVTLIAAYYLPDLRNRALDD